MSDELDAAFDSPPDKRVCGTGTRLSSAGARLSSAAKWRSRSASSANSSEASASADGHLPPGSSSSSKSAASKVSPRSVTRRSDSAVEREKLAKAYKGSLIIDPRKSKFMPTWDIVMIASLLFTSIVTPYEVTFVDEGACVTPLFVVNRVVDGIFIVDLFLQFFMIYSVFDPETGTRWIEDHRTIVLGYLRGWFAIDLLSVLAV